MVLTKFLPKVVYTYHPDMVEYSPPVTHSQGISSTVVKAAKFGAVGLGSAAVTVLVEQLIRHTGTNNGADHDAQPQTQPDSPDSPDNGGWNDNIWI